MDNTFIRIDDRLTRPMPTVDPIRKTGDGDGPSKPDVKRPESRNILDRMKRVDPNQAKRYRQRSGQ
jgi:hypothetical protein